MVQHMQSDKCNTAYKRIKGKNRTGKLNSTTDQKDHTP
jgi:hypothetical protein